MLASEPQTVPRPESKPEIRLERLTKRFGEVVAVDDVSLTIESGEFFSLLGPSGCGKTTTLRMIGGFDLPTSGRIDLRGHDVTRDPPDKRPVNMVFQSYALFPHLDVAGNIAFGLKRRGVAADEIRRRTGEVLELVNLPGYEKRRTNQMSGGQQQRIALARALVNQPNVLLLDEPLGALDLKLRKRLQLELKRIQMEIGITFVYVTHDQEEALTMSDRIAVMNRGRIEQVGTPEDLYDRPSTPFVADFIGTTNLLSGTVGRAARGRITDPAGLGRRLHRGRRRLRAREVDPVQRPAGEHPTRARRGDGGRPGRRRRDWNWGRRRRTCPPPWIGRAGCLPGFGRSVPHSNRRGPCGVGPRIKSRAEIRIRRYGELAWSPTDALILGDRPAELEDES